MGSQGATAGCCGRFSCELDGMYIAAQHFGAEVELMPVSTLCSPTSRLRSRLDVTFFLSSCETKTRHASSVICCDG